MTRTLCFYDTKFRDAAKVLFHFVITNVVDINVNILNLELDVFVLITITYLIAI